MVTDSKLTIVAGHTPGALRWSLVAGFLAFAIDLGVSYPLRGHACSAAATYQLHLVTILCFAIALSGFLSGWSAIRRLPHDRDEQGPEPHNRAYFQALLGIILSLGFSLVVLANAIPRWMLDPCH